MSSRALAVLVFVGCIWGTSFLFIRIAVDEVTPAQLVFFRGVGGAVALLAFAALQQRPMQLDRSSLGLGVFLAVVGAFLPFLLIAWAETRIESGPTAVLNGTLPLFTLIIAAAVLADEEMTAAKTVGVAIGFGGIVVLVGRDSLSVLEEDSLAQGAVLLATALYAVSAVVMRMSLRRWSALTLSTLQVSILAVIAGVFAFATSPPHFDLAADTWLSLLSLGFLGTGVAYIAYYWLIENVGSVRATFVAYIIPVVGVAAGVVVLGEAIRWNTFVGGAVILVGIGVGNGLLRWPGRTAAAEEQRLRSAR
jgi:drug/metabolite transporter (DMT)-like permease